MKLSQYERSILGCLDESGGFPTRRVAELVEKEVGRFGHNRRTHSGSIRAWLDELKKRGLVDYLDDQKPVCWKRTETGRQAWLEAEQMAAEYEAIHRSALRG